MWRLISYLLLTVLLSCAEKDDALQADKKQTERKASFKIEITLDPAAYRYTNFGEPPQLAVWLESKDAKGFYPLWVSQRAAKNNWKGKIECPLALPYWEGRRKHSAQDINVDAFSGATPLNDSLSIPGYGQLAGTWYLFVEVNVSADYNKAFAYWSADHYPDSEANGQPSLIYRGAIDFSSRDIHLPQPLGRTKQFAVSDTLVHSLAGMTTAKNLLKKVDVIFE